MGDVEQGERLGLLDDAEAFDESMAARQVERRDRLVAEQEPGARGQRAGQPDALALASRECRGPAVEQGFHPAERRDFGQTGDSLRPRPVLQTEPNVRRDAQVWEEQVVLEDHPDLPGAERYVDPRPVVEKDRVAKPDPTAVGRLQSGDQAEQGRLARARGTEDDPALAPEPQRDVECQPRMDPPHDSDVEDLGRAQRRGPGAGRVRWTTASIAIARSEIQRVSHPARVASLTWTAS